MVSPTTLTFERLKTGPSRERARRRGRSVRKVRDDRAEDVSRESVSDAIARGRKGFDGGFEEYVA